MDHSPTSSDPRAARAGTFPWPPVLFVAVFAAAWWLGAAVPLFWPGMDDLAATLIGRGFGIAGIVLIAWSLIALNRANTTVMPHGVSDALVTTGPYTRFRNPIYLGEVLVLLSVAEFSKNIWFVVGAATFAILVTALQILPEERHLQARFGDAYTAYRARSRRWI
ncbi:MAG: isoprenylcysteine carboxylmethyltransferase family protein [Hyphomicrobium sp.]|nr:isoprenylcysteine carboxylmethyltransferase family protein [Hyphomicrobium sp.]